jgi:TRAP-type mannitol/chloroaromatic compound transport system substrate-binding protein
MQKLIVGIVIGAVVGILFGASVVAPRLIPNELEAGPQRTLDSETVDDTVIPPEGNIVETVPVTELSNTAAPSGDDGGGLNWELASAFPSDMPLFGDLPRRLEKQIETLSGGASTVRFHEPDTLAPASELMEAVRSGAVDVAYTAPVLSVDQIPALGLFGGAPFGPTPTELLAWLYAGGGMEELNSIYHNRDLHALPCGLLGAASAGWSNKKITSPEDFAGLRMRIDGPGAAIVSKLGAEPVTMLPGRVAQALKDGEIDAAELSLPSVDLGFELHRVADYYYFPGWHHRSTLLVLMMRLETWQSLTANHQGYLEIACGDNTRQGLADGEATQLDALKRIISAGVDVLRLPDNVLKSLAHAWRVTAQEYSREDEEFAQTWRSLYTFQRDFGIWYDLNQL